MSLVGFPLLLIPLAVYNIIAFLMPSVSFGDTLFKLPLVSHALWPVTLSDILLTVGVVLLLLEVIKAARPGAKYLTDHLLSFVVFACAAAEFVMWQKFGTSTYFLLTLLSLTDFLTGVALHRRRAVPVVPNTVRRQAVPEPGPSTASVAEDPAVAEPVPEPASPPETPLPEAPPPAAVAPAVHEPTPEPAHEPAGPVRSAASVAESVLMDHPARKPTQPVGPANGRPSAAPPMAGSEASPDMDSPELQPESHAPASPEPPQQPGSAQAT
jgi:hypothetical protein